MAKEYQIPHTVINETSTGTTTKEFFLEGFVINENPLASTPQPSGNATILVNFLGY